MPRKIKILRILKKLQMAKNYNPLFFDDIKEQHYLSPITYSITFFNFDVNKERLNETRCL